MNEEQELRDRLDTVEVPALRLTVEGLVGAGRRRVRRRRTAQVTAAVALVTGVALAVPAVLFGAPGKALPPAGPTKIVCGVTRLAVPAGMKAVTADAIDPTGRYVIGNDDLGPASTKPAPKAGMELFRPVLWTDGQPQALPASGLSVRATAVNASGTVVAVSGDMTDWTAVLRYTGGRPTTLTTPPGDWAFQSNPKINSRGDIVVTAGRRTKPDQPAVVFFWPAGSDRATRLPLPAGAEAQDLTDDRTIFGDTVNGNVLTSYTWDLKGNGRPLTVPAGQMAGVNAASGDWATGNLWPSGVVARWNLRTGALTVLDTMHGPAGAINGRGWIVGLSTVLRDDATVQLAPVGTTAGEPEAISDNGLVVGSLLIDDHTEVAKSSGPLQWRCG